MQLYRKKVKFSPAYPKSQRLVLDAMSFPMYQVQFNTQLLIQRSVIAMCGERCRSGEKMDYISDSQKLYIGIPILLRKYHIFFCTIRRAFMSILVMQFFYRRFVFFVSGGRTKGSLCWNCHRSDRNRIWAKFSDRVWSRILLIQWRGLKHGGHVGIQFSKTNETFW